MLVQRIFSHFSELGMHQAEAKQALAQLPLFVASLQDSQFIP